AAASVAVSSWTLVAISCERYYAICHPLRSRTWQTINHAYKIIGCIWFGSIVCMAPIAIFSQLIPTSRQGLRKCREQWPEQAVGYERSYNIFLDLILLVLPLGILCIAYILITRTLYLGIKDEKALIFGSKNNNVVSGSGGGGGGLGNTHSTATVGDGKVYTQVASSADMKTTNVFKLNFSFRYPSQRGGPASSLGAASSGNNGDGMLQIVKSTSSNGNGNGKDIKYLGPASGDSATHIHRISNNDTRTRPASVAEAAVCKSTKESHNEIQQQQSHDKQPQNPATATASALAPASVSSSTIQLCYDDITQMAPNTAASDAATNIINPLNNSKRAIVAKTTDGRRQQLYCMRSASFKSFNRSSRTSADSEDTTSSSCHSLNALSNKFQRHSKLQSSNQHSTVVRQSQYHQQQLQQSSIDVPEKRKLNASPSLRITESALRRSNLEKNLESKKRVVKMLFVLVLEFFICWTPLYVINTVAMFIGPAIYEYVDYTTISFFQLLAYSSSCCNPITYCFMNASFRRAFVDTFRGIHLNGGTFWHKSSKTATNLSMAGNSIAMGNSCTVVTANTVLDSPRL
uniref:G-protein coupled receptors family 1 profile domain-containing protein n=1 Tax=Stomoxys calcitrans TaxID=35570 RepID=A0A1I8PS22_STOCA